MQKEKIIRIIERQGNWFVYIKYPKARGYYYKLREDTEVDPYMKYYEDKIKNKRKGSISKYLKAYSSEETTRKQIKEASLKRQARDYLKRISSRPKIQKAIKKGISTLDIKDLHSTDDKDVTNAYRKILAPLVLDQELLTLLCKEENIQKIKHRFEYQITVISEDDSEIGQLLHIGKKTLKEVIDELKENTKKGMSYGDFSKSVKDLGNKGYSFEFKNAGNLKKMNIKIIFRKG